MPECECPSCGHVWDPRKVKHKATDAEWDKLISAWNEHVVNHTGLPAIRKHGTSLRDKLGTRLKDLRKIAGSEDGAWKIIGDAFRYIRSNDFYWSKARSGWTASALWVFESTDRIVTLADRWKAANNQEKKHDTHSAEGGLLLCCDE